MGVTAEKRIMKIGIYDPYLDTLGGGEKYILSIASLLQHEHKVSVFWNNNQILQQAENRFNLSLKDVTITNNIFLTSTSSWERFRKTIEYDCIFFMSDGSIPTLGSKKTILIYQFALPHKKNALARKLKVTRIHSVLCYSQFVKEDLVKEFGKKVVVLYPPVDPIKDRKEKENSIITVGRFTRGNNVKKHDVLIRAFQKFSEKEKNWKLHIVGSHLPDDEDIVDSLKKLAKGSSIFFHANVSYKELSSLYATAKIYWHATGYQENVQQHPERAEQFGISTVEAMSAGCVPVVINSGGQKEIVDDGVNGFRFDTVEELIEKTQHLINNPTRMREFAQKAVAKSRVYSFETFSQRVKELV